MSNRIAVVLERILEQLKAGNTQDGLLLLELIKQLLEVNRNENAPADNKGNSQ